VDEVVDRPHRLRPISASVTVVTELLGITATLVEVRKRLRLLRRLRENFAEVRKAFNELARTVR
jgi:hypothetical protein